MRFSRFSRLSLPIVALFTTALLAAQRPGERSGSLPALSAVVPLAGVTAPGGLTDTPPPMPEEALIRRGPKPHLPKFELVPGKAPDLAPGAATEPRPPSQPDPRDNGIVVYVNGRPGPTATSTVGEPTASINQDCVLYTGNWYAAFSFDSGKRWSYLDPATKFPAADGGFCCDQYTVYVPPPFDITIWLLQYDYSAATLAGRHRIAVARGRSGLLSQTYNYYDFTPQAVGFGSRTWFDFPHVARSNGFLYVSSNVFDPNGGFVGSSVMRLNLGDMSIGAGVRMNAATGGIFGTASHRLAAGPASMTTMYYGAHTNFLGAPQIRIFSWPESATTVSWQDRFISGWYTGVSSAPAPDGRDWLGRDDHRMQSALYDGSTVTFLWGSAPGGSYPRPFVRAASFNPANGYNLAGESSIWSPVTAWAYPSAHVNARGNFGGTIAFGGGTSYPGTAVFLVDATSPGFAPLDNAAFVTGGFGPSANKWGDYLTTAVHSLHPYTYVGTGMAQVTGTGNGQQQPAWAWFGRANDTPAWAQLTVDSQPARGITIGIDSADLNDQQGGATMFQRTYAPYQGMTLTAPATAVVSSKNYVFDHWSFNGTAQQKGQLGLGIWSLNGQTSNTADAVFTPLHVLLIDSLNASGVPITVQPPDWQGQGNGVTPMNRFYLDQSQVTLTAPATFGGRTFKWWARNGRLIRGSGPTHPFTIGGDDQLLAVYSGCGAFVSYGTSCSLRLVHDAYSQSNPSCGPQIGDNNVYAVRGGYSFGWGIFLVGASNQTWNGLPLPVTIPGSANCQIYTDMLISVPIGLGMLGDGSVTTALPNNRALMGLSVYTQYATVRGVEPLQTSNGIEVRIGG